MDNLEILFRRLERKGFSVTLNPYGDGDCFYAAAAFQLGMEKGKIKEFILDNLEKNQFDIMPFTANESSNGSRFPYESCLIPNIPEDVQHQVRSVTNYFVVPLEMLLAVLSFLTNSLVMVAIVQTRALQHPSQLLLCNLSVTDLLWALFSFVKNATKMAAKHMCPEEVKGIAGFAMLCYMSTLGNLAIISRDRYLAVSKPWWYRSHVNRTWAKKQALAVWLFSVVLALVFFISIQPPLFAKYRILTNIVTTIVTLFYVVCILIVLSCYVGIFVSSRRQKRNMPQQGVVFQSVLKREKQLATTIGLILLVLVFTFFPGLISPLVFVLVGFQNFDPFRPFYQVLLTLNGLLNPLVNFGRNQEVRQAVRNLIGWLQRTAPLVVVGVQNTEGTNQLNASGSESAISNRNAEHH